MNDQTIYIMTQISNARANVVCRIEYCDDETIHAFVDNAHFVFEIGSDDDEYVFVNVDDANDIISFPMCCDEY